MAVVDASVLVAGSLTDDPLHERANAWLEGARSGALDVIVPSIGLSELAGAVRRVTGEEALGRAAAAQLGKAASVLPVNVELGMRAAEIAAEAGLRGCDAVYVALAEALGEPLVSLDKEQLTRAARFVRAVEP